MELSSIDVRDPFSLTAPVIENGEKVEWVVRSPTDPSSEPLTDPMSHYDAMRFDIERTSLVLSRVDIFKTDVVAFGYGYDDRHLTQPTNIDITPALAQLSMQDFVDIQAENFEDSPATRKILDILEEQGDPRAGRLRMYEKEWSSPDEDGNRAKACLQINQDSVMNWLEANALEIHDELTDRARPYIPSI